MICSVSAPFLISASRGQTTTTNKKRVLVISNGNHEGFLQNLEIDKESFEFTIKLDSQSMANIYGYDIVVLYDPLLSTSQKVLIKNYVNNGGSAIILMGQNLHDNPSILLDLQIINGANFKKNDEIMLLVVADEANSISQNIDWNSAPHMKEESMTVIPIQSLSSSANRIVDAYPTSRNLEIEQYSRPILVEMVVGRGNVLLFT